MRQVFQTVDGQLFDDPLAARTHELGLVENRLGAIIDQLNLLQDNPSVRRLAILNLLLDNRDELVALLKEYNDTMDQADHFNLDED